MRTGTGDSELTEALRSSGIVGNDLLAVAWEATPLGPVEAWPRSLATVVSMVLTSRFPMWMAWGPELTFFCNDAYRRDTLGKKYPWALGRPAKEVWEEIWPEIGPRIENVLSTGQATWDEALLLFLERSGYREETYHTFSYSPVTGDDGEITGMLCVVTEDTDRVIGERRLRTLRELGSVSTSGVDEYEYLRSCATSSPATRGRCRSRSATCSGGRERPVCERERDRRGPPGRAVADLEPGPAPAVADRCRGGGRGDGRRPRSRALRRAADGCVGRAAGGRDRHGDPAPSRRAPVRVPRRRCQPLSAGG